MVDMLPGISGLRQHYCHETARQIAYYPEHAFLRTKEPCGHPPIRTRPEGRHTLLVEPAAP